MNLHRVQKDIRKLGEFGKSSLGGITRLPFSEAYNDAANWFSQSLSEAGCEVCIDSVRNVIGILPGKTPRQIMIGSHLDTVIDGGLFDGALGVVAALELVRFIREQRIELSHTLVVAGFSAEEGGHMGGTFGSRAMMGLVDLNDPNLPDQLKPYGLKLQDVSDSYFHSDQCDYFLEMHIEQGDTLYRRNIPVGIVTGIVGITRYAVNVIGESNHAGTTSMKSRKDAFLGFSRWALTMNHLVQSLDSDLKATVGEVHVYPNMPNIIPGHVESVWELRHIKQQVIDDVISKATEIALNQKDLEFTFERKIQKGSCMCDPTIIGAIKTACAANGVEYVLLQSGAGHDANAIASRIPVGMIFLPSISGISHNPNEKTSWMDIHTGLQVLYDTMMILDRV